MNESSVALAALGILATSVAGNIWLAKYFAKTLGQDLKEHTKAAQESTVASMEQTAASQEQKKASKEVLTFMKALNGKLAKATIQTIQEQKIEHQEINNIIQKPEK